MKSRDDVLATTEMQLKARPVRAPDYQVENRALGRLAREMADRPGNVVHVLCEEILAVCDAESAGISLLSGEDGQGDFVWPAVAGAWATYAGGGMPRDASPCGVVIDHNACLLFQEVERDFPAVAHAMPRIREILLAPFCVAGRPIGTVWAIIHSNRKQFDREDRRVLESIAEFAAAAYQLNKLDQQRSRDTAQIAASEAKYRSLFEGMDEGFCIIEFIDTPRGPSTDYVHLEANGAFCRNAGLPDSVGRSARDLIGDEADEWIAKYRGVLESGKPVHFSQELTATGKYLEVSAWPSGAPGSNQVAILFTDTSERRTAETALERLAETLEEQVEERSAALRLYRDIVQSDQSPVVAFDTDMRITAFNQAHAEAYLRVYGIEQRIGDSLLEQFVPEQAEIVRGFMARALAGESFIVREEFGDPDIEVPHWQIAYSPLRDEQGDIIGGFHHALDITSELRAQHDLERTQDALRQSQKMEAIGQLTGGVAHDFNNLLTVIRGSVDLLRRENVAPEKRQRYLDAIGDTADRASKLTAQLLAFARRQTLEPEVIDVGQRLDAIGDMLDSITGSRVSIRYEVPDGACRIRADVSQFETALVNLAVNARDAMGGEGTVTIRLGCNARMPAIRGHGPGAGDFVAISITDTGVGIAAEDLERIFEPFFTTKEVGKGTGLGLSQVFGFAKQSGGDVDVESVIGQGSTFTLYLPQAVSERADHRPPVEQPQAADGEGRCVLVVEDNISVGQFATQLLDDLGYKTHWVTSAEEALEQLGGDGDGFDIVFSDVVMPGMGGIELARRLANDLPTMPVVLASGYSHVLAQDGIEGLELIRKPYSANQLSVALQRRIAWAAAMQA